ncbi:MAG TPA: PLP-dependent aminotransferase family protein [Gemmatimonadales bacterium]|nr:PLP-dependent aminotransferase family protein [Gemmatimonadales bacterium]
MSPRTASSAPPTLVRVDPGADAPLHRQIYDSLRDAIVSGRLAPGLRVPPTRVLAHELQVSRNTASAALAQLRAEGYLDVRPRSGTFVRPLLPDATLVAPRRLSVRAPRVARTPPHPPLSRQGARVAALAAPSASAPRPFRIGFPALDAFPWELWARLTNRRLRHGTRALYGYGALDGYRPLREAIAAYVAAARGAACTAAQVIITSGAQHALDLVARLLVNEGDAVWLEDPGYPSARAAFAAAGARLVPVPVNTEGLDVATGMRRAPRARLVYTTPSRQYPLGLTMSAARRLELLQWAARANAWVVEDDYDSEFRYVSRPLACLQGLDESGRVLYVGTFSKTLFPGLRLGYLIVPLDLAEAFGRARGITDWHSPTVEQAVLSDFITEGHFARHVRRMRVLYQARRDGLLAALRQHVGDRLELGDAAAGMHVFAWLPRGVSEHRVAELGLRAGLELPTLSSYATEPPARGGVLLGYAEFTTAELDRAVARLATVLERASGR